MIAIAKRRKPTCINLKERYGTRFKVVYEESYGVDRGERGRTEDPWLMILLCDHGHIYLHGGDMLAASTNKRGSVAKRLRAAETTCRANPRSTARFGKRPSVSRRKTT